MKVPFNINLSGKTAIVTGGSGTLCSAMTYGLAVSGAKVAIIGRNIEKLASVSEKLTKNALDEYNKDVTIKGYSCNVINKDELTAAYETIKNELGSCDILINGAGGNQPGAITSIEMLKKDKEDSDYSFWNLDEDRICRLDDAYFVFADADEFADYPALLKDGLGVAPDLSLIHISPSLLSFPAPQAAFSASLCGRFRVWSRQALCRPRGQCRLSGR